MYDLAVKMRRNVKADDVGSPNRSRSCSMLETRLLTSSNAETRNKDAEGGVRKLMGQENTSN